MVLIKKSEVVTGFKQAKGAQAEYVKTKQTIA
jgi:hypothetical protein